LLKKSFVLLMLLFLAGGVALADVDEEIAPEVDVNEITAIEIKGNDVVTDEEIKEVIDIEIGDIVDADMLYRNMEKIYEMGWFHDIWVDYEPYQGGLRIIFEVMENFEVSDVVFSGVTRYDSEELKELLRVEPEKVLNTRYLNEDLPKIEEKYHEDGYILARIVDISLSEDRQELDIEINEGFLGEVTFSGNEKTRDYVIEREIELEEGEVFNARKVQSTLQNIYRLGFFSENIESHLDPKDPQNNVFDLHISLEEVETGNIGGGGGYNTRDGFYGFLDLQERNLLGRGQEIGVRVELGRNRNYEINFREPHLLDTPYSISTRLFRRLEREEVGDDIDYYNDRSIRQGGSLTLGRQITDTFDLSTRFRLEHSSRYDRDEDGSDWNEISSDRTHTLTLTGTRDTRQFLHPQQMSPSRGGMEIAAVEMGGYLVGGDYDFTKYTLELRRYFPGFADEHSWAMRLKGGTSAGKDALPRNEKFVVGGAETLRGYDRNFSQGEHMVFYNLEYRFPIYGIVEGTGFFDTGLAWGDDDSIQLSDFGVGIGAGVRLNTPLGMLRFDLGYSGDEGFKPYFSIGHTF